MELIFSRSFPFALSFKTYVSSPTVQVGGALAVLEAQAHDKDLDEIYYEVLADAVRWTEFPLPVGDELLLISCTVLMGLTSVPPTENE